MKRVIRLTLLAWLMVVGTVQAQTLKAVAFTDQWEKANPLTEQTQWVVFSHHMTGGDWVKESLTDFNVTNLARLNGLYVADVSGMPSLITKYMAMPKMRDYAFQMALAMDDEMVEGWPQKEDQVSVILLDKLSVKEVKYFADKASLQAYLKTLIQP